MTKAGAGLVLATACAQPGNVAIGASRHPLYVPSRPRTPWLGDEFTDERACGLHRVGGFGQEGPEQLEGVGLDREELEAGVDAVILCVSGERLGVDESGIAGGRLYEDRWQAAEVRAQRIDDWIVRRMAGQIRLDAEANVVVGGERERRSPMRHAA